MSAIEINNLTFGYSLKKNVINNISLKIEEGEYVAILGHNGSGKSTLAKLINGLLKKDSGDIFVDGLELTTKNLDKIRENVGIVFQNPDNQFFGITVKDDIAFGLENRCFPKDKMEKIILDYATLVGMEDFLDKNPEELSGGQKQRVAIASVLAFNPKIIILDEATSMLDPQGVEEVIKTIKSLVGVKTIISITHNLNEVKDCDRVIVLNSGSIVLDKTPLDIFQERTTLRNANLDIPLSLKLIDYLKESDLKIKKEVEKILWEYTFKK